MVPQILKTMSRRSVMQAGLVALLASTLSAVEASATEYGFGERKVELGHGQEPVTGRQSSDDIVLAQDVDDCGCDDAEDYGDDYDDDFNDEYADEDFEEYDEDYARHHDDEYHGDQGSVQAAEDLRGKILDRQAQIIEKTILWRNPMGPGMF